MLIVVKTQQNNYDFRFQNNNTLVYDCQKWQLIFCVHAFFQLQNEKAKLEQELRDLNERRESQLKENQDLRAEIEGLRYTDTLKGVSSEN